MALISEISKPSPDDSLKYIVSMEDYSETFHAAGTVYYHTPEEREIPHCSRFKLNQNINTNQEIHIDSRDLDIFVTEMSAGTHNA